MKCLVTGATGFIGQELCARLAGAGQAFEAWSHRGADLPDGTPTRAVDFSDPRIDPGSLQGIDTLFHLAGIAHRQAPPEMHERINFRAVVTLAQAARDAGVGHFVFLSSVKAMGPSTSTRPRDEAECTPPTDAYGLSKWRAEETLRESFADGPMAVTIIRPALVYGPGASGNLAVLARAAQRGMPRPPEQGARSMISSADLARLLLCVAGDAAAGVRTWIATDGQSYSTRRIYDCLRAARGRGPAAAWLPRPAWRAGAALLDLRAGGTGSTWEKLFGTELYSNARVCSETSWRPRQRLEDVFAPPVEGAA